MRICLLNDSFPPVIDGVANTVLNYATLLTREEKASVIVATPRYPGVNYAEYPFRVLPYKSFDIGGAVEGYRAGNPLAVRTVSGMMELHPDVIHTHCPVISTMLARQVQHETDAPLIFTYHTKFDLDIERAVRSRFLQKGGIRFLIENISACDEVWAVSKGAGENLKSLGYTGEYTVMENGVDFPKGRVEKSRVDQVTAGYDLPEGVPVFLFVGRLLDYKGLPLIVDALQILAEKEIPFRMVWIGGGADAEALQQRVKEAGLSDRAFFTGPIQDREELRAWNTRADLFLFPSTYDTNGIVVREAAACALASVLIRDSSAAEGISDGRNGFLIDHNAAAMAALLERLCAHPEKMREAGKHAMEEIYVSWSDSVKHAYERYQVVIENKKAGRYKEHRAAFSRRLLGATAEALSATSDVKDAVRNNVLSAFDFYTKSLREGMMENISERIEEYRKSITARKEKDPE